MKSITPEKASILSLRRSLRDALDTRVEIAHAYEKDYAVLADYAAGWRARAKNAEVALVKELADQEALAEGPDGRKRLEDRLDKSVAMIEKLSEEAQALRDGFAEERKILLMNSQTILDQKTEIERECEKRKNDEKALSGAIERASSVLSAGLSALPDPTLNVMAPTIRQALAALQGHEGVPPRSTNAAVIDAETVKAVRESLSEAEKDFTPTERAIVESVKESLSPTERPVKLAEVLCSFCAKPLSEKDAKDGRTRHTAPCSSAPARPVRGRVSP